MKLPSAYDLEIYAFLETAGELAREMRTSLGRTNVTPAGLIDVCTAVFLFLLKPQQDDRDAAKSFKKSERMCMDKVGDFGGSRNGVRDWLDRFAQGASGSVPGDRAKEELIKTFPAKVATKLVSEIQESVNFTNSSRNLSIMDSLKMLGEMAAQKGLKKAPKRGARRDKKRSR